MKKLIIIIGFILIGAAFLSAALVGVVALREGGGFAAYSAAGKPAIFLPGTHLVLVVVVIAIVIWVLVEKIAKWVRRKSNHSLHGEE